IAGPPVLACPTGGICAQPGTAQGAAFLCADNNGCSETVYNQQDTVDRSKGTLELYYCEQCCVSWVTCPITVGGSVDPCPTGYKPNLDGGCNPSPIIIDVDGSGFRLTNAAHGVQFDIFNNGTPVQVAWTATGSTNAFLVLDRNGNGKIDSGGELFGNVT